MTCNIVVEVFSIDIKNKNEEDKTFVVFEVVLTTATKNFSSASFLAMSKKSLTIN
jgi:hypothetical protein